RDHGARTGDRRDHDGRLRRRARVRDSGARPLLRGSRAAARLHGDHGYDGVLRRLPRVHGDLRRPRVRHRRSPSPARGMSAQAEHISSDDFAPAGPRTSAERLTRPSLSYWQDAWRRLKRNRRAYASLYLVVGLAAFAIVGPWLWPRD